MQILETRRLCLRQFESSDLDQLFALYSDPAIVKYIPDAPRNYQEAQEELEWFRQGHPQHPELGLWATLHKETGRFIGRCGLLPWTLDGQFEIEVAYTLAREFWGQGLGTEAAQGILRYGFEQLHLPRLICLIDQDNVASVRVAQNIGMAFERTGRDAIGPFQLYSRHNQSSGK